MKLQLLQWGTHSMCILENRKNMNLLQEIEIEQKKQSQDTIFELLVSCFDDDPVKFGESVRNIKKRIESVPDMILWNNFYLFLQEGNFNYDLLRKLPNRLDESGNRKECATCIVYMINRIDDPRKARFISMLTLSVINDEIKFESYFRLVKLVENMTYADLVYLAENVERIKIDIDCAVIDDFLASGLAYSIDGGFSYSEKAFDLVEFGVRRGYAIRRPKELPDRQALSKMSDTEVEKIFNEVITSERE